MRNTYEKKKIKRNVQGLKDKRNKMRVWDQPVDLFTVVATTMRRRKKKVEKSRATTHAQWRIDR